ncbi:MAG: 2-phospho-L-lactate guanylyltransferase [Microbacterium sp.]
MTLPPPTTETATWTVVVPVKPAAIGKSRLAVDGVPREDLARAMALDTILAASLASDVSRVVVVTDDSGLAGDAVKYRGVDVIADGGAGGLNGAIARGAEAAGSGNRAALLGDLPGLRHDHLHRALRAATAVERGVVADAAGTGSTLVTAAAGAEWMSSFGDDSFARHVAGGFVPLELPDVPTLRHDVDTAADLEAAGVHVGPNTRLVLRAARSGATPPSV